MRIGILTFHRALNYGAVLQTYASVQFLRSLGHEVYVLDYTNPLISEAYRPSRWDSNRFHEEGVRYILKYPVLFFWRSKRKRLFEQFISSFIPTVPYSDAASFDVLLVGSDQVWNKALTGGEDPVYFGDNLPGIRKVAWSASAGKGQLTKETIERIQQHFDAISVREPSLSDLIPGSIVLPDPTMLISAEEWKQLISPVHERYLLAYPMNYQDEVIARAIEIAKDNNLELKVLSPSFKLNSTWDYAVSPEAFLSLIYSAEYVVTSSYHGAVFTLMFNRPHTFVYHDDPRFDTLLSSDFKSASARAKFFVQSVI